MATGADCPIPNTHRRLSECHRLWHRAADSYDDPDEFRTDLNALIQALRNVTFILQKEKRAVADFEAWYEPWRDLLRKDGVLAWAVEARNRVVKEGDLETLSTATVTVQASWDQPTSTTFEVPPLLPTLVIAASLAERADIPEDVRKGGLLTVERRWVARDLPEWELLDALAHCYEMLSHLVTDAHRQAGSQMHVFDAAAEELLDDSSEARGGRLPCMVASEGTRSVVVHLGTNEIVQRVLRPVSRDAEVMPGDRYGPPPKPPGSNDPLEWAPVYMEYAKRVLARDGYHIQIVFLIHPSGRHSLLSSMPADQQEKYLFMNDVANEVRRFDAKGLVFIADSWIAPEDAVPPGKRAGEVEARGEALTVTAARSDGATKVLITPYAREGDEIIFSETSEIPGDQHFVLAPVFRVWGLSMASELETVARLDRRWRRRHGSARNDA